MGLPKEYAEKLKTLVRRETVELPDLEIKVTVRGLTGGEFTRLQSEDRPEDKQIAITVEKEDGSPMWLPHSKEDLDEIAEMQIIDRTVILQAGNNLSGLGKLQALLSQQSKKETGESRSGSGARSKS